jgi:hypothetical protein
MATYLKNLLRDRSAERVEENLNKGKVFVFSQGTMYQFFRQGICWIAPADGTAVLEAWGAGGSGAEMCCCGFGVPGNAGAYSRKTITMTQGQFITGATGMSCGNATDLCFRGCSEPSGICWQGCAVSDGATDGCICAQGGRGGTSICSTTPSGYCCFRANGFCVTRTTGDNCGIACNYRESDWHACGYGGDINCCGQVGCSHFFGCYPRCPCQFYYSIPLPANMFVCGRGSHATYRTENDNRHSNWSGQGRKQSISAINAISHSPTRGITLSYCWRSNRSCGCYEDHGCQPYSPIGSGGAPPTPCPGVRDHAVRGGHGGIRIRFIES